MSDASVPNTAVLRILVADDTDLNLILLCSFIEKLGHIAIRAHNGQEAVDLYRSEQPDLVLLDVIMPEMNGYEACRHIREHDPDRWVPVIFLSALGSDDDLVKGLESGGDDYLTKPINLVVLNAKIRAMQRIAELQRQISEKAEELADAYYQAEEETQLGGHLMEHMTDTPGLKDPAVQYWLAPAGKFSGDLITAVRSHNGSLYAMLADAAGHGLAAALNVFPATEVFQAMATHGFPVGTIATEINRKMRRLMPLDRFIACAIVCLDPLRDVVEVWNGGAPAVLLLNEAGEILSRSTSQHPPLGILPEGAFSAKVDILPYSKSTCIFLCSDGVSEAENAAGEPFGDERIEQALRTMPGKRLGSLRESLQRHLGHSRKAHDDISVLFLSANKELLAAAIKRQPEKSTASSIRNSSTEQQWSMSFNFHIQQLRTLDIIPTVTGILERIETSAAHTGPLHLILSELFNNALDHGILRLDSTLKEQPDGFERYLQAREQQLQNLQSGFIQVSIAALNDQDSQLVRISVKDSGSGFDHAALLEALDSQPNAPHGRGIMLTRSLSEKLEFLDHGSEVVALYRCN